MANDFLPFSTSGTANVYTNAEYVADTDHSNGNQPGIAKSKLVNKALRQSSLISAVVAQFIADIAVTNAVDDGTTATLLTNLKTATNVAYNTHAATSKTTPVDADEIPIADSAATFGLKKLTWANLKATLGVLFAPLASPTFTGTPTLPSGTIAVTQANGDNSTKVATTAFSYGEVSKLANGYIKLSNGLIVQWVTSSIINAGSSGSATFPITFPTACLFAVSNAQGSSGNASAGNVVTGGVSAVGVNLYNWGSIGAPALIIAIGY